MSRMLTNFIGPQACKNWMLKSRTILFLKTLERTLKRWFCPFKSFWCQVKSWTQTQVTPRSIPYCHCWVENLNDLLSLQYKENKGKFAAFNGHLKAKSFSASGGEAPWPPDQGLCPWTPLGAPPPDPRYRLVLPRSPCSSPPKLSTKLYAHGHAHGFVSHSRTTWCFLFSSFNSFLAPCARLSWPPVSFWAHLNISSRVVSYRIVSWSVICDWP